MKDSFCLCGGADTTLRWALGCLGVDMAAPTAMQRLQSVQERIGRHRQPTVATSAVRQDTCERCPMAPLVPRSNMSRSVDAPRGRGRPRERNTDRNNSPLRRGRPRGALHRKEPLRRPRIRRI